MKAAVIREFGQPLAVEVVPDPVPVPRGVVIRVEATGICRSDWHAWMGHDPDIRLPHVPGHELAGTIEAIGNEVDRWQVGDRVTLPFVCGCGRCLQCVSGNAQVCDRQFQPGFTAWGSFAEFVAIDYADYNLVRLPESISAVTAASLGCRFATSFRAVVDQGKLVADQWVAVHGCGGVGLSAIMIAKALGALPVAIDISDEKLALAKSVGAVSCINVATTDDVVDAVRQATHGGAHLSIDALGDTETCRNSIACLRKRGKHIQVGLLLNEHSQVAVSMDKLIAGELEILGSHGMQAHRYPKMLDMILAGRLDPGRLVGRTVTLEQAADVLVNMNDFPATGVVVIDTF
jgi:alcohol dehydrogenase